MNTLFQVTLSVAMSISTFLVWSTVTFTMVASNSSIILKLVQFVTSSKEWPMDWGHRLAPSQTSARSWDQNNKGTRTRRTTSGKTS
ncbi:hypothetical protein BKA64DRAFT_384574 [Cadophora sp. MPI-SDFR-AT-0126]|nr:hypothetical protein BKA64DRAFT_384574 [Leotiomycetes sp. MPI-SDFR-AT-0126]